jgi:hypothetical protein
MSMFGLGHHGQNPPAGSGPQQPTFKIFCKGDEGYCLTVRDGNVVLTPASQPASNWYKDMRFSSQVKDEEGCPGFSLVNAATGRPSSTPPPSPTPYTSLAFSCSSV